MILRVQNLNFSYKNKPILYDINFNLKQGELLAILGPNGAGKSTLLKCINGLNKIAGNTVFINDKDIRGLTQKKLALECAFVPQNLNSIQANVFDAILLGRTPHIQYRASEKDLKIVDAALKRLNISHLAMRSTEELSGGELQKVYFARALVQEPSLLLLDEPTSALDILAQTESLKMLKHIVHGHNMTAIMTMHDINLALRFADRCLFLNNGKIVANCTPDEITPEIIKTCYNIDVDIMTYGAYKHILVKD